MKKIKISSASSMYISGIILATVTVFVLSGVIFLLIAANKPDVVMSSPSAVTYTYFMMIMDRIIAAVLLFWALPLSIYQWTGTVKSQEKRKSDKIVSAVSVVVLLAAGLIFLSGEMHFFEKYKEGRLDGTQLFSPPVIETKIFDMILTKNNPEYNK